MSLRHHSQLLRGGVLVVRGPREGITTRYTGPCCKATPLWILADKILDSVLIRPKAKLLERDPGSRIGVLDGIHPRHHRR